MFGGIQDPSALSLLDDELKLIIEKEAALLFGATQAPLSLVITRWSNAIPLYSNSLASLHDSLKNGFCGARGQVLFSNYSGQVSIRGMIETLLDNNIMMRGAKE